MILFFFKKDATFYENTSFLLYLLISVSRQVNRPDSRPDSRLVSHPVSRPICLNIFPKWIGPLFSFFSPFWQSSTLSHPMAIFSANEIRTFFICCLRDFMHVKGYSLFKFREFLTWYLGLTSHDLPLPRQYTSVNCLGILSDL